MNTTTNAGEPPNVKTNSENPNGNIPYGLGFLLIVMFLLVTLCYGSYLYNRSMRSRPSSPLPFIIISSRTAYIRNHGGNITFSQGIDDDVLVTFPTFVYSEAMMSQKKDANSSDCSICLAEYKPEDVVRMLPQCRHLFHDLDFDDQLIPSEKGFFLFGFDFLGFLGLLFSFGLLAGKNVFKDGEELLRNVTTRKMTGKGDASVSNPCTPIKGIQNPNSDGYEGTASFEASHGGFFDGMKTTRLDQANLKGMIGDNTACAAEVTSAGFDQEDYTQVSSFTAAPKDSNDNNVESGFQSTPVIHSVINFKLFGVSLKTLKDFEDFIKNIRLGNSEVWLKLSEDKCQENYDTLCAMFKAFKAKNINDSIPSKVTPSDPIVQSVDINTKSTSYVGAAGACAKNQPKVTSNFRPLMANLTFDGVNISIPRKVVKKSSFARCLVEINFKAHLVDIITTGIPSLTRDGFTKETIRVEKKRKGRSKSINDGQFIVPLVKQTVRYKPNATTSAPNKGATNVKDKQEKDKIETKPDKNGK
nr:RING-H2 finger protein ATL70-like [Tanacetum cinerariifolium]